MLGRFFKSKDDSAKQSSLPPGHRPGAGKPDEPPMGGGFFNLAPTVVKGGAGAPSASPGQTGPAPHAGAAGSGLAYQHRPSGTAPSGYASGPYGGASMPPTQQQHPPPGHTGSAPSFSSNAPSGGMDMFGDNELAAFLKAKEKAFANQLKTTIAEQSYVMLQKQHNELEKSLSVHRNAIASAEAMIPQLEQEKKNAATQRNFKEAARISKDIKALEKDQSTAEEMVEVVEMELQDLKERIVKREAECEDKKEELKQVERQLELNALQELWKEAKLLRNSAALEEIAMKLSELEEMIDKATEDEDYELAAKLDEKIDTLKRRQQSIHAMVQADTASEQRIDSPSECNDEQTQDADDSDGAPEVKDSTEIKTVASMQIRGEDLDNELKLLRARITMLEADIERATENEDYDTAAQLDDDVQKLRVEESEIMNALSDKNKSTDQDAAEELQETNDVKL
ncbi:hypothetical protein P43SY_003170 [Pythium insidiosum]|uniref:UVR domain-containing protein n=1 Tax=Pythium insidiosum TaxID=114742 RepID=A0AAD5LHG7_PYTIN|nr:hypothetical protein P43SY_003170 [Pythium insidiosum]